MANFVGALTQFNPYVQQIPTDAYVKVGMAKEQQYQMGVQKVQDNIDRIAGLDIANEGGRQYLRSRVDELTDNLNKYSRVDFSNPENVTQLVSLAKPLYQDENIVNDVINTGIYRNWDKLSRQKMASGNLDPIQHYTEQQEAAQWLNSDKAGAAYTGRQTPNDSTYDKINKKLMDFKSKLKPSTQYSEDGTWLYGNKAYNTSQLSYMFYNQVLDGNDKEILMNNHIYNDSLRYNENPNAPKEDLLRQYNDMKSENENALKQVNIKIEQFKKQPNFVEDDPQYQNWVQSRDSYTTNLQNFTKQIDAFSQPSVDPRNPSIKKGIYASLAQNEYLRSISGIFEKEQMKPEYRPDVQQSRDHHKDVLVAAITKGEDAYTQLKDANGNLQWEDEAHTVPKMGIRPILDENLDPSVLLDPNKEKVTGYVQTGTNPDGSPKFEPVMGGRGTTKGASAAKVTTILKGTSGEDATFNVAGEGDQVHVNKQILTDQYDKLDGDIQQNILGMMSTIGNSSTSGFKTSDYFTVEQHPGSDGKDASVMVWKSPEKRREFMGYVEMMNTAWKIEQSDGKTENSTFLRYMNGELNSGSSELGGSVKNADPKAIEDLMKLKGNNAIITMMDNVFKDKSVQSNLAGINQAIEQKRNISNVWRKVLNANSKNDGERGIINSMPDQDLMRLQAPDDRNLQDLFQLNGVSAAKYKDAPVSVKYSSNGDGTYTATAYLGYGGGGKQIPSAVISRSVPKETVDSRKSSSSVKDQYKDHFGVGNNDEVEVTGHDATWLMNGKGIGGSVWDKLTGGQGNTMGIDNNSIIRANQQLKNQYSVIRQNITRSMSMLNEPANKQDKDALIQTVGNSLIGQAGAKLMTDPTFIQTNETDIDHITSVEDITGASDKSVGSFFNNSGFVNVKFKYKDKDGAEHNGTGSYNIDRILATDPNFASKYSKYFASLKYAQEGAAIRLQSYIDPVAGHETYSGKDGTGNIVSPTGTVYQDNNGALGANFSSFIASTSDGHQVPINYRIISYGNSASTGNTLRGNPKDNIENGKYAIQFQLNTPGGKQNVIFRTLDGGVRQYNTPEEALYQLKDEMFQNMAADHPNNMTSATSGTKVPNYFIEWDDKRPSMRGFFNTQMRLAGHQIPTMDDLKKTYSQILAGRADQVDPNIMSFNPIFNQ